MTNRPATDVTEDDSDEGKKVKARVAGALGTHRAFLKVSHTQRMTAEKRVLEKSLEATKKEWEKLK